MDSIQQKLDHFLVTKKVPNILFHGPSGSGKRTLVNRFLYKIYGGDRTMMKMNVMTVECSHGKGIKFIREELKFFAKTNIQSNYGAIFKSIVLLNADSLTIDAQSALRRCIELFSHTTRFFIVVENKERMLNPILSRFCEMYVPEPYVNREFVNLHSARLPKEMDISPLLELLPDISGSHHRPTIPQLIDTSLVIYEAGFSALDVIRVQGFTDRAVRESEPNTSCDLVSQLGGVQGWDSGTESYPSTAQCPTRWVSGDTQRGVQGIREPSVRESEHCHFVVVPNTSCTTTKWQCDRVSQSLIAMCFYKIKPDFRCEKMLIFYVLYFLYVCSKQDLQNLLVM